MGLVILITLLIQIHPLSHDTAIAAHPQCSRSGPQVRTSVDAPGTRSGPQTWQSWLPAPRCWCVVAQHAVGEETPSPFVQRWCQIAGSRSMKHSHIEIVDMGGHHHSHRSDWCDGVSVDVRVTCLLPTSSRGSREDDHSHQSFIGTISSHQPPTGQSPRCRELPAPLSGSTEAQCVMICWSAAQLFLSQKMSSLHFNDPQPPEEPAELSFPSISLYLFIDRVKCRCCCHPHGVYSF